MLAFRPRPKSVIYTLKRGEEHPRHFHTGLPGLLRFSSPGYTGLASELQCCNRTIQVAVNDIVISLSSSDKNDCVSQGNVLYLFWFTVISCAFVKLEA